MAIENITIIGAGTIGLSFCALHLKSPNVKVTIHDPRTDLLEHVTSLLPGYLPPNAPPVSELFDSARLNLVQTLDAACTATTDLVQEQGPESSHFKSSLWPQVEALVSPACHLWTSTSGIPASLQAVHMETPARLVVVHPFNPPHIMPLIEIVPSPDTPAHLVAAAKDYFETLGHSPVVITKEKTAFVANRLAFVFLREACSLVDQGVVTVPDLDKIVEASLGLRWGIKGPFASYHDGGGAGGLAAFMGNVGETVKDVWAEGEGSLGEGWEAKIVQQTEEAYGAVTKENFVERDRITRKVLETIRSERAAIAREKADVSCI